MQDWKRFFLIAIIAAALVTVGLAVVEFVKNGFTLTGALAVGSAILSLLAVVASLLTAWSVEDRAHFSNAFAITRRWDEAPVVISRDVLRPYLDKPQQLITAAEADAEVRRALVDFLNFFWDMSAAVELKYCDPRYLKLRFAQTLLTLHPALVAFAETSQDASTSTAMDSIDRLRRQWGS